MCSKKITVNLNSYIIFQEQWQNWTSSNKEKLSLAPINLCKGSSKGCLRTGVGGWGFRSVGRMLALQTQGPGFDPHHFTDVDSS